MTPKEKAQELIDRFWYITGLIMAKNFALICIDEITKALEVTTGHCSLRKLDSQEVEKDLKYWEQVKNELNNL